MASSLRLPRGVALASSVAMARKTRREAGASPRFLGKTIEQLKGADWGPPAYDSYVVRTVHALRKKPLDSLTDEELRLSLSQEVGLPWIAELAIHRLEDDPLRSGDFQHGDVLMKMLGLSPDFWVGQPALATRLRALAEAVDAAIRRFEHDEQHDLKRALTRYLG